MYVPVIRSPTNAAPIRGLSLHPSDVRPCAAACLRHPAHIGKTDCHRSRTRGWARRGAPFYPAFTVSSIGPFGLRSRFRRILLKLLAKTFLAPNAPLILLIDGTLERRWGKRIAYKGRFHDAVRSASGHVQTSEGIHWLCVMLLVRIPWCQRRMSHSQCSASQPSLLPRAPSWANDIARQRRLHKSSLLSSDAGILSGRLC